MQFSSNHHITLCHNIPILNFKLFPEDNTPVACTGDISTGPIVTITFKSGFTEKTNVAIYTIDQIGSLTTISIIHTLVFDQTFEYHATPKVRLIAKVPGVGCVTIDNTHLHEVTEGDGTLILKGM